MTARIPYRSSACRSGEHAAVVVIGLRFAGDYGIVGPITIKCGVPLLTLRGRARFAGARSTRISQNLLLSFQPHHSSDMDTENTLAQPPKCCCLTLLLD